MQTIRNRISRPYLLIIILMPVTIILLFNLIVSVQNRQQAQADLENVVAEISQTVGEGQNWKVLIQGLNRTNTTDMVVFNKNGSLNRMFDQQDHFVTPEMATFAYKESLTLEFGEIGTFSYDGDRYYMVRVEYDGNGMVDVALYISKGFLLDDFVKTVNTVLLVVSLLITIIALWISKIVTNSVAKPIERLTELVEHMRLDEQMVLVDESNSVELQRLTQEINAMNRRIYHQTVSQKNFLHDASHELRTPLMSIQGYADGIEMGVFSDAKATAHLISDQTKRLTKLVESLLKLARAENFHKQQKLERLCVSDSIVQMIDSYQGYALNLGVEIEAHLEPNVFANMNNDLFLSGVGNILANAIRYGKKRVGIFMELTEHQVGIVIRDDGSGVPDTSKIFDRFAKGADGNFGLGLSIAKVCVETMNGTIQVHNDNGAVFQITLQRL